MADQHAKRFASVVPPRSRAELQTDGVSPRQLRGRTWIRVGPNCYLPAGTDCTPVGQRIVVAARRLPVDGAIGGWAAAYALGADQCDGLGTDGATELDVPLVVGTAEKIRERRGTDVWYDRLPPSDVIEVDGVPVTAAQRTCFDGMRRARGVVEAVVFADQMFTARLVTVREMQEYVAKHPGWRGVPQARRALELADPMARNGWETRIRMVWMLDAGLPKPLCNPPVFDLHGNLLGYPDILDPAAGTVGEFDGKGHRQLVQHSGDNVREEAFEDHGLVVTRATSVDFGHRADLAKRMQRAWLRGRRRDRRQDRWTLEAPSDWGGDDDALHDLLEAADRSWQRPH